MAQERQRNEEEIQALHQTIEGLRVQVAEETKKYDRNASVKNLAEAEKGARRQVDELMARATIIQLTDQLDKVTADSNKKSTKIEDLRSDSSKKSSKVDDLRNQRTGLRNRLDEQAALHQLLWKRETPSWPTCERCSPQTAGCQHHFGVGGNRRPRDQGDDDRISRDRARSSRHSSPPSHPSVSSNIPAWQSRLGQGMAAFPGSRWPNTVNQEQTAMARLLRFGTQETQG